MAQDPESRNDIDVLEEIFDDSKRKKPTALGAKMAQIFPFMSEALGPGTPNKGYGFRPGTFPLISTAMVQDDNVNILIRRLEALVALIGASVAKYASSGDASSKVQAFIKMYDSSVKEFSDDLSKNYNDRLAHLISSIMQNGLRMPVLSGVVMRILSGYKLIHKLEMIISDLSIEHGASIDPKETVRKMEAQPDKTSEAVRSTVPSLSTEVIDEVSALLSKQDKTDQEMDSSVKISTATDEQKGGASIASTFISISQGDEDRPPDVEDPPPDVEDPPPNEKQVTGEASITRRSLVDFSDKSTRSESAHDTTIITPVPERKRSSSEVRIKDVTNKDKKKKEQQAAVPPGSPSPSGPSGSSDPSEQPIITFTGSRDVNTNEKGTYIPPTADRMYQYNKFMNIIDYGGYESIYVLLEEIKNNINLRTILGDFFDDYPEYKAKAEMIYERGRAAKKDMDVKIVNAPSSTDTYTYANIITAINNDELFNATHQLIEATIRKSFLTGVINKKEYDSAMLLLNSKKIRKFGNSSIIFKKISPTTVQIYKMSLNKKENVKEMKQDEKIKQQEVLQPGVIYRNL